ncbi:glycoside hydrolase family 47 protein [Oidiodendron maius Zn]|uniref:alpha-1,2-Mannosidase n=1 Tax=Oidiodendron maius (strain Zn) TaxID=913774 RepID=A0A0C3CU79_OIDMZ|nr:glycoside hydrolase family 47 protein [Oidiodendron maius Zn]
MLTKRLLPVYALTGVALITFFYFLSSGTSRPTLVDLDPGQFNHPPAKNAQFQWSSRTENHPLLSLIPLPAGASAKIPSIQNKFTTGSSADEKRRQAVKETFIRAWKGYREYAWLKDELAPISGGSRNHFGGWAATLVDSLDTLWIMDLKAEYEETVEAVKDINFSTDTPNRMPITRWQWKGAMSGEPQKSANGTLSAELGSLSLEFTRLSLLTGDAKFFDAIQRITDRFEQAQSKSKLPGMWPTVVNPQEPDFGGDSWFTLGAMADSLYEYLPKQYMLLGGPSQQYRHLYEVAIDTAKTNLFFTMTPKGDDILLSRNVRVISLAEMELDPQGQHLTCFVGGMMGIGSRIFDRPDDLPIAQKLVEGCL